MKKGFTLIELLAVIVILAIISLIAIPIIVNIIEDSKEASRLRSAELYISTLNTSLVKQALKGPVLNGTYDVMNNGNLCLGEIQNDTCNGTEVKVEMEGTLPTSGSITIENGKIIDIQGLTIEGYVYGYDENNQISKLEGLKVTFNTNGGTEIASVYVKPGSKLTQPKNPQKHEYKFKEWKLNNTTYDFNTPVTSNITLTATYEETELYTLMTGQNFNNAIKTLVSGSTVSSYKTTDDAVEYIEFYSNGELPEGYTLNELESLPSTDVSNNNNDSIKAYYDSTKKSIYIYSEGEIVWNSNSNNMFYSFKALKEFVVPYNVTSIGNYAFLRCSSLTSITIPNSVTSIGSSAFSHCSNLASITVDPNNTVYEDRNSNAIIKKSNNELVVGCKNTTIPDSVTSIGSNAFYGCSSLTSITIPDSVTSIGSNAFDGCNSLTSITIPNSVTSIGYSAFEGCSSLTSITLGSGVTSIGYSAFEDCSSLASITIPSSVTSIGDWAFSNCSSLTSITIPDSVTSIGADAFWNCSSLTSVTIGSGVTSIGEAAFAGCLNLTNVTIPRNVTFIDIGAFNGCNALSTAVFEVQEGWSAIFINSKKNLDLSDASNNATYLKDTYSMYFWKRS